MFIFSVQEKPDAEKPDAEKPDAEISKKSNDDGVLPVNGTKTQLKEKQKAMNQLATEIRDLTYKYVTFDIFPRLLP